MLTKITKSCSVRLNGEVKELTAGETIALPIEKAQRLVDAGYATHIKPDIEEYRRLTLELSGRDPKGGCWDWIVEHQPETWRGFMQAFMAGDTTRARQSFDEMIATWKDHLDQKERSTQHGT